MLAESFFTEVALSYRSQLEESDLVASYESLRDYCKSRRVAWRNFVRWAVYTNPKLPRILIEKYTT
jgi:hypothetical protein